MTLSWRTGLRKRLLLSFYSLNQLQQSGSLRRKGVARNTQKREHNQHSGFISNNSQNKTIKKNKQTKKTAQSSHFLNLGVFGKSTFLGHGSELNIMVKTHQNCSCLFVSTIPQPSNFGSLGLTLNS